VNKAKESPWFIAGQGAIGSFCAANLERNNKPYNVIVRDLDRKQGQFAWNQEQFELAKPITLRDKPQIGNLLVPLKAYDVEPFIKQAQEFLQPKANIILCHNGMGTLENVKDYLSDSMQLYFCTTSSGANKRFNIVTLAGIGESFWSRIPTNSLSSNIEANRLQNSHFKDLFSQAEEKSNLKQILWNKLLVNCVINPLTAIHGVQNGQLQKSEFQPLIKNIVNEFINVAEYENTSLGYSKSIELVNKVISTTANNTSSMLQDVQNQRRTEIDYITGYLLKTAEIHGIDCPINKKIYQKMT